MQSISTKMYDLLSTKILQGSDTAIGTVVQKRCSKTCGLNLGLIYIYKKSLKIISKTKLLKRFFSRILITTITIITCNMQLTEHFFHNSCLSKHKK